MKASVRTRPSRVLSQESPTQGKLRLFLALDLPSAMRDRLSRWGERELGEGLRQVAASDLHVTIAFLGWRQADEAGRVWRAVAEAGRGLSPPRLEPGAVVAVPRRRPRLVALDLADLGGTGAAWHAAVWDALEAARLGERERRPFWPHVTLARGRKGARVRAPASAPDEEPFTATALTLYRSDLSAAGVRYTALETVSSEQPPAAAGAHGQAGGRRRAP